MRRDLDALTAETFDVVVVGGGVYGAAVAREAALRGLSVALLERADFGHATSANSLRVVHGGLRYLQDIRLGLLRRMVRERSHYLRMAPHLVHPLPFLMPTYGHGVRSRAAMGLALRLNDLLASGADGPGGAEASLPTGEVLDRQAFLDLVPGLAAERCVTGGVRWHDAQVRQPERFVLALLRSAVEQGGRAANYVEATGLLVEGGRVRGVRARDALDGRLLEIRGRVVVNAAGPWVNAVLSGAGVGRPLFHRSLALNLVVPRLPFDQAVALPSGLLRACGGLDGPAPTATLFIVPCGERSLIGTVHFPLGEAPDGQPPIGDEQVEGVLAYVRSALPGLSLRPEDVLHVQWGYLPVPKPRSTRLVRDSQVVDHGRRDGLPGLFSLVGVKFTLARWSAEQAVNRVSRFLGRSPGSLAPSTLQLVDGADGGEVPLARWTEAVAPETAARLTGLYGSRCAEVLDLVREDPRLGEPLWPGARVIRAQVVYAVREEMAQRVDDVLLRRVGLPPGERLPAEALAACAQAMAAEMGWSEGRLAAEVEGASLHPVPGPS